MNKTLPLIFLLLISITTGYAADCRVTKTADTNDGSCTSGDCSLREAVAEPSCSTIDFSLDLVEHPVVLTLGEIEINRSLTISGWGADAIGITSNNTSRIFYTSAGTTVTISGVTLALGNGMGKSPFNGGAVRALGNITLDRVYLRNNTAPGLGAAVSFESTSATQKLVNSTVAFNIVNPGNFLDGAVYGYKPRIYNSTISNNDGGGLCNLDLGEVVNSTIANNGTKGVTITFDGLLYIANSVLLDIYLWGIHANVDSAGTNIASRSTEGQSASPSFHPTDLVGVNPMLGGLGFNGGPMPTLPIDLGSPAVDAGNNTLAINNGLTTDQRGHLRIFDGDGSGTATVDIGAFEFGAPAAAAPVSVSGRLLTASGMPIRSASIVLSDLRGNVRYAVTSSLGWFTFDQVPANIVYKISISSKRYFAPEKVIFADQNLTDADIIATPYK